MIWLAIAAAAAGMTHSVLGAFGFVLGDAPGSKVAVCERTDYPHQTSMFFCPGDAFFKNTYVNTHRSQIEILSASRLYREPDTQSALRACLDDLQALRKTVQAKYPALLPAWTSEKHAFRLSETLLNQMATGRRVEGRCQEPEGSTDRRVVLWLTYSLSDDEIARLIRLDDADDLKKKGLNPERL